MFDIIINEIKMNDSKEKQSSSQNLVLQSGEIKFSQLPKHVQTQILTMQNAPSADLITLNKTNRTAGIGTIVFVIAAASCLSYLSSDHRWDIWSALGTACWMTFATYWVWKSIRLIYANNTGYLCEGCYLTQAYIIETTSKFIRILPLWEIKSITRVDHYDKNKEYTSSTLEVVYLDRKEEIFVASKDKADCIRNNIIKRCDRIRQFVLAGDIAGLKTLGVFENIQLQPLNSLILRSRKTFFLNLLTAAVLACVITAALWQWNNEMYAIPPSSMQSIEFPAGKIERFYEEKNFQISDFSLLTLQNNGANKMVKFLDTQSDKTVLTVYLGAVSEKTIIIPAGKYKLFIAEGADWYGNKYLFGENTSYDKSNSMIEFKKKSGHKLQFNVKNGNIRSETILPNEFRRQ